MPLNELSPNVPRSRGRARISSKAAENIRSASSSGQSLPPPPNAVQRMLKTTTELGGISLGQPQAFRGYQYQSQHRSMRRRSGSLDSSFAPAHRSRNSPHLRAAGRYDLSKPRYSASSISRNNTARSSLASTQYSERTRHRRLPHEPRNGRHDPGPRVPARPLYNHRSLNTLRNNWHKRSTFGSLPMAHDSWSTFDPRVSSPAPGPSFPYNQRLRQPTFGVEARSSVASSPASINMMRHVYSTHGAGSNSSLASMARVPSPAIRSGRGMFGPTTQSLRWNVPPPILVPGQRPESSTGALSAPNALPSPSEPRTPSYYDYSESFSHQSFPAANAPGFSQAAPNFVAQSIPEDQALHLVSRAQTPFGIRSGSAFCPVELPAEHNEWPQTDGGLSKPPTTIPKRRSSLAFDAEAAMQIQKAISVTQSPLSDRAADDTKSHAHRLASSRRRSSVLSFGSTFFSNADRGSRDLTALAARVHSPKTEDPMIANPFSGVTGSQFAPGNRMIVEGSECAPRGFNANGHSQDMPGLPLSVCQPAGSGRRPQTSPNVSQAILQIISPSPRRPLSSQSRTKLSKILDFKDGMEERGSRYSIGANATFFASADSTVHVPKQYLHRLLQESPPAIPSSAYRTFEAKDLARPSFRSSAVISNGRSTVESLLDHHIEALGLQSPARSSSAAETTSPDTFKCTNGIPHQLDGFRQELCDQSLPQTVLLPRTTIENSPTNGIDSDMRRALTPHRLFSSNPLTTTLKANATSIQQPSGRVEINVTSEYMSAGWQTLTSDSHNSLPNLSNNPSLSSGDLADIDTSISSSRFKVRRRKGLSQTVTSPALSSVVTDTLKDGFHHRRSKSEILKRAESYRRRHMKIRIKLRSRCGNASCSRPSHGKVMAHPNLTLPRAMDFPTVSDFVAELEGDATASMPSGLPGSAIICESNNPARWSSIIAAMPQPATSNPPILRQVSVRTRRSDRSNTSLAEPLNTSRVHLIGTFPRTQAVRLQLSDQAAKNVMSDLNLSIPYTDTPSTIFPSSSGTKGLLDGNTYRTSPRTHRRKFAPSSLRSVLGRPSAANLRNDNKNTWQIRISNPDLVFDAGSTDHYPATLQCATSTSGTGRRGKRMMGKLRKWWQKNCMSRSIMARRKQTRQNLPGGLLV